MLLESGASLDTLTKVGEELDCRPGLWGAVLCADAAGHLSPMGPEVPEDGWVVALPAAERYVNPDDASNRRQASPGAARRLWRSAIGSSRSGVGLGDGLPSRPPTVLG